MGTVGLSFGSPTSGAGFNVSQTVSEIVGNLENVETPWKNQLSTLESQDTVLSSLGTLFSNLANDMSSLTDFNAVLAQKTGSSSDTNVLELASASTSAIAGTHSVVVNNLAQTSSGYLAVITDASDTLSGAITLQVGTNGPQKTITLNSSDDTLAELAAAINASGVGISANVLTDSSGSRLSLTSGTSGAGGNILISSNSIADAAGNGSALAYTGATSGSSGTLSGIAGAADALSGSVTIQGQTINVPDSPNDTLAGLMGAINGQTSATGVKASVAQNSDGTSSLSLATEDGSALSVTSTIVDTSLGYTSTVTGKDASLVVDGVSLTSSSNMVSNLIPGLTFQLLSASPQMSDGTAEPVQVVIGNNNTGVESTVNQFVSDYNALISAINTQEGTDSSGTPEPLFGSPSLSLLQQELLGGMNELSPSGYLDSVSTNGGATLSGSMTINLANGTQETIQVGPGTTGNGTFYTGSDPDSNTLGGLAAAINSAAGDTAVTYSGAVGGTSGTITASDVSLLTGTTPQLMGNLTIQVGGAAAQTISADDVELAKGGTTISDFESYINDNSSTFGVTASIDDNGSSSTLTLSSSTGDVLSVNSGLAIPGSGVTAAVQTANGESWLTLVNQAWGTNGSLSLTSSIRAATPAVLDYQDSGNSSTAADTGVLGTLDNSGDTLGGYLTIQVGSGVSQTIHVGDSSTPDTLAGLASAINVAQIGVSAQVNEMGTGLNFTSATSGSAGALTITSNVYDASNVATTSLNYNAASDIDSLTALGISVNNDGSLTFDANTLDSLLNTDYGGVASFFQDANSWGTTFSNMLEGAGTGSSTGVLKLAQNANSSVESNLNANISKEENLISAQQKSLTAELNSANEILQQLPSQLEGVNELYSAITGFDENQNG
jgi:flagellar hook-associated protein 2